jgi:hypothetical protein
MSHRAANSRNLCAAFSKLGRILCIVGSLLLLPGGRLAAQEPEPSVVTPVEPRKADATSEERPESSDIPLRELSGRIQYVGPDTYILLDENGRPQPLPNMKYEDFLAAWKQAQLPTSESQQARFTVEKIDMKGQAQADRAELRFEARLLVLADEPVEVPLGLVGAIVQEEPQFSLMDEHEVADRPVLNKPTPSDLETKRVTVPKEYMSFNPQRGGLVAHINGHKGQRWVVSLKLLVPLIRDGHETTLTLNCPRAVASSLTLAIDGDITDVATSSGTVTSQEQIEGGGTRLVVKGAMGPYRLSWQTSDPLEGEMGTVLGATGSIRISIDGRSVRSDAQLTVTSYGGRFDRFRVRLPRGARLRHDLSEAAAKNPAYRIRLVDGSAVAAEGEQTSAGADDHPVVVVELVEKRQGPVVVELATEQPISAHPDAGQSSNPSKMSGTAIELSGFDVLGAVRQFGDVALEVAHDWQARWNPGTDIRQVDPAELDSSLQSPTLTAAFQYDRQPWSLNVEVAARQSRVHVTPKYELDCSLEEARLRVHLSYQIIGARAFQFRIRMEGWEMTGEPVESGGLVDQDRVMLVSDDVLVLPLSQGVLRRAEVSLSLRRPLSRDSSRIELPLPVALADSVATGELVVRPTVELNLLPDVENSQGLTPALADTRDEMDDNDRSFHFRTLLPHVVLVGERVTRQRNVEAEVETEINLTNTKAQIEQRIGYDVQYQPMKEVILTAPQVLVEESGDLEIDVLPANEEGESDSDNGAPLPFAWLPQEGSMPESNGTRKLQVALPQPLLGKFVVRLRYQVAAAVSGSPGEVWSLPLIQPAEGQIVSLPGVLHSPPSLSVQLAASATGWSWKPLAEGELRPGEVSYEYVAEQPQHVLPLLVKSRDADLPNATTVDRVWMQTWLSDDMRQERAVYRFRTSGSKVVVELPPQISPQDVEMLLDGRPAEDVSREGGRIVVRLGDGTYEKPMGLLSATHTLELRFRSTFSSGLVTHTSVTPPQLTGNTALAEFYWQFVLPADRHIVRSPTTLTPASQWQWLGSFWGLRPIMSQADLEKWIGASTQIAPAAGQNEYLYTGLAPVRSVSFISAPRWVIVLVSSSTVLLVVLAWVYFPFARRKEMILVAACFIAALAVTFPAATLRIAQASVLGIIVAFLAIILARLTSRPSVQHASAMVSLSTGSTQRMLTPRPESIVMPPVTTTASTAPTSPGAMRDSE